MRLPWLCFAVVLLVASPAHPQTSTARITLPNGWSLTPAGTQLTLGDLPLNCAISHGKTLLAVTNNGQSRHSLQLVNLKAGRIVATVPIPKAWFGLAFGDDDRTLYASGGNDNWILRYDVGKDTITMRDTLVLGPPWPRRISPAGLAVDEDGGRLYVVTKEDSALYTVDLASKRVAHRVPLGGEGYTCLLSGDRTRVFASCWGADVVRQFSTKDMRELATIRVGDNPNDMCLSADGDLLYVANANDNSVSVIDLAAGRVIEALNAALYPNAPSGSTTNSVALSENGETLYIANADNNCLAVFDVRTPGKSRSLGFIPTGWYPTSVRIAGDVLYVANGKGLSSMANPYGPNPAVRQQKVVYQQGDTTRPIGVQYIGGLFKGALSIIPMPDQAQLAAYSRSVYQNTPYTKEHERLAAGEPGNPVPQRVGDPSPITHVFYVIKENRTYDQVLGDMPEGNGDTSLVLFGERITPNQHLLAWEFVLLDNFFVDGEVSADGHNWSMGAYATDYLEKTWPTNYGGRGGGYDAEGARGIANNKLFIWDQCSAKGVSYRTYGEFTDGTRVGIKVLEGHVCSSFTSWDQSVRDTTRFAQWKREFDSLVVVGGVPRFNTLRFINDHTEGLRRGRATPFAAVADNDLAVGLFVEYLSKSPIWNESVVFIVEDDAQNGPDHVDAHRSTAYVAGGRVKRHFVDHTPYTTSSVLRTIELILGLDPMSQYDAGATPMWRCFTAQPDRSPFVHVPNRVDLGEINLALNEWQRRSEEFDFTMEDRAPDDDLNRVLWFAVKGAHVPFPAINRAAFLSVTPGDDDDD
ncbi:MAG: bifunctional YncE family protein/alkaline phosphatase family protein [Ignavibacteriae bacterium]|nr:bifunctional YncE family protein/alkaline phosphatase family protein [Ignavibacteriota bacterium]